MKPQVLDLYHGDRVTSFAAIRNFGVGLIIHKASEGADEIDHTYAARRQIWERLGGIWAAYHFLRPGNIPAQAKHFLACAKPSPNMMLVVDYEAEGLTFADLVGFTEHLDWPDDGIVVYGNPSQLEGAPSILDSHRLWLAQYSKTFRCPSPWRSPWLWQFSDRCAVAGVANPCDGSVYV